jgi:class 3 adenylate cyclase/predicted ATPase
MSFEQVLEGAIALLKRRRRITYATLQRQFGLADDELADLKQELTRAQRIARDEDGVLLELIDVPGPSERRRLTVMFCDLVGSTRLASALDPEDLHELVCAYQEECAKVLRSQGGHIAQYLGDGILAYFGYPAALEDDAERAVRAGLALVQAVAGLSPQWQQRFGVGAAVRVGIHTGLVVMGDVGAAHRRETLALGEAPNLAAHIQSRAEADTVLVSEATLRLLQGRFTVEDRGTHDMKGARQPLRLARVLGERDPSERRAVRTRLLDPAGHLAALEQAWAQMRDGHSRVVALRGEAGIGKTRLADELRSAVHSADGDVIVLRCSAFHRHSALHPIAQHIAERCGLRADAPTDDLAERLRPWLAQAGIARDDALPLLAALVAPGSAAAAPVAALAPPLLMQATLTLLLEWISAASRHAPLLLVWEDVHWADASSLALLKRVVEGLPDTRMLTVLTARPDFAPPWPASTSTTLALERLPSDAVRELVQQVAAERALAPALVERIVATADGVPLYAEEITKAVLDSSADDAAAIEVPATLHASLLARLDRLGSVKPLTHIAALLGRDFSLELLAAVSDTEPDALAVALQRLVGADLLRRQGTPPQLRYAFRHALLQTAAEESMLRVTRQQTHLRIADALEAHFPGTVESEPETLARHLTEGGVALRAIAQWLRAGERALARSAVTDALAHLDAGLALLPAVADPALRDTLELGLQIPRASALRAAQGVAAPATGAAYERACALARQQADTARLIPALNGLYSYHLVRGQCDAAQAPAQQLLEVARERHDRSFEMIGHRAVGAVAFHVGDPVTALLHLERSIGLYDPAQHAQLAYTFGIDHKVTACNFLSLTMFVLDDPDAALAVSHEGLAWAETLDHAHSLAQALVFNGLLLALRGDWRTLPAIAERTIELGRQRGFPLMEGGGRFLLGAAQAFGGNELAGLATLEAGATQWWATGARNYRPFCEMLLGTVHARLGDLAAARRWIDAAKAGIADTGERWLEPELLRVEAELLHPLDGDAARESRLQQALALAHAQQARAWERRAALSLAACRSEREDATTLSERFAIDDEA